MEIERIRKLYEKSKIKSKYYTGENKDICISKNIDVSINNEQDIGKSCSNNKNMNNCNKDKIINVSRTKIM